MKNDKSKGFGFGNKSASANRNSTLEKAMALMDEKPLEGEVILKMEPDPIDRDPNQPRKKMNNIESLAATMQKDGQIQPIVVRVNPKNPDRYIIVIGERRWTAAKTAGLVLDVIVRDYSEDDLREVYRIQLKENDERENLTALEDCLSVKYYMETYCDGQQKLAANDLGKSIEYVSKRIILLKADQEVLDFADDDVLNDVDTLVAVKKLYVEDKKAAQQWMKDARDGSIEGPARKSAQNALKKVKTGRNPKKTSVKVKSGRIIKFIEEDKNIKLKLFYQDKEENDFLVFPSDLDRLIEELTLIKKRRDGEIH